LSEAGEYLRRVTQDGDGPSGYAIGVDKGRSLDVIPAVPADGKRGIGFFNLDRLAFASMSQPCGQPVGGVEQPGIGGFGGEKATYVSFEKSPRPPVPLRPKSAVLPIETLAAAAAGLGHTTVGYDRDGAPRYDYVALPYEADFLPSLRLTALRYG